MSELPIALAAGLLFYAAYKKGYIGGGTTTPPGTTPPGTTPPTGSALFATVGDIDTNSDTAAKLAAAASVWIGLGDYAYSGSIEDWANEVMSAASGMTWYGAQGNHDSSNYYTVFGGNSNSSEFTVQLGPVLLICLNTESMDVNFATSAVEQGQADASVKLIIPFMHYPIQAPEGSHHAAENAGLHDMFAANSKVKLVLNGHNHNYSRMDVDGIKYVCIGCGGRDFYEAEQDSQTEALNFDTFGIGVATDTGAGLNMKVTGNDGSAIDDFTITY